MDHRYSLREVSFDGERWTEVDHCIDAKEARQMLNEYGLAEPETHYLLVRETILREKLPDKAVRRLAPRLGGWGERR